LDKVAAQVSARVAAQVDLVECIPALPNGKYKWVVQECQGVNSTRAAALPDIAEAC
jgi:hypothetical protein